MVDEKRQLISCMLDIGKEMVQSGAEISVTSGVMRDEALLILTDYFTNHKKG